MIEEDAGDRVRAKQMICYVEQLKEKEEDVII